MRKCLLVLGMHRSGTSALAGHIFNCGVFGGEHFLSPLPENPRGFYESKSIYNFNEKILEILQRSWSDNRRLKRNWTKNNEVKTIKKEIIYSISKEFKDRDLFFLKEPRISILLPLYLDIFHELNIKICPLIVKRKYIEIAYSLNKRNRYSIVNGIALSHYYYSEIFKNLRYYKKTVFWFDEIVRNPNSIQEKIMKDWDVSLVFKSADYFIDESLKRNNINVSSISSIFQFLGKAKNYYYKYLKFS